MSVPTQDITAVIAPQHERVKELLGRVTERTGESRREAFHHLRLTLILHELAEQRAIHSQTKRVLDLHPRAATDRIAEEQEAAQTLGGLGLLDVDSDQFDYIFAQFSASVREHAAAEETEEWPVLQQVTDPVTILAMIRQMQAVPQLAAHPAAPGPDATFAQVKEWAEAQLPPPPGSEAAEHPPLSRPVTAGSAPAAAANGSLAGDLHLGTVVIDVQDMERAVGFWTAALGYVRRDSERDPKFTVLIDPAGRQATVSLQIADSPPGEPVRVHLDLFTTEQKRHIDRLAALGAEQVRDWPYPPNADFVVMRDPDGNEFCVIQHSDR